MNTTSSATQTMPPTTAGRPTSERPAEVAKPHSPSRHRSPTHHQNISSTEKTFSQVGGAALVLAGLSRGRLSGLLLSLVGGSLLYRHIADWIHGR